MSETLPSLPRRLTSVAGGVLSLAFLVVVAVVVTGLGSRTAVPNDIVSTCKHPSDSDNVMVEIFPPGSPMMVLHRWYFD